MADARRDEERGVASAQLEAFHETFNFCMNCRQYTCTDCWNPGEGRCQTCAPLAGHAEADAAALEQAAALQAGLAFGEQVDGSAWPTTDLSGEAPTVVPIAAASEAPTISATPYMPTDLRPVELPDDDLETMIGEADIAAQAPDVAPAEGEPRQVAARSIGAPAPEAIDEELVAVDAAGSQGLAEDELVAAEAETIAVVSAAGADAPVESPAEAETIEVMAAASEPSAAEVAAGIAAVSEPSGEAELVETGPSTAEAVAALAAASGAAPEAAEPEPTPAPAPTEPAPAPASPTRTPAPGWTMVAPDVADGEAPSEVPAWPPRAPVYQPPSPPSEPSQPLTPGQPAWPTVPPAAFTVAAAQTVWEESSLGVLNRPGAGVQACVSCGLPLSATARFCRRCGTRQAG